MSASSSPPRFCLAPKPNSEVTHLRLCLTWCKVLPCTVTCTRAQPEHAAGTLRGPENLYNNVTNGIPYKVNRLFPASKRELQESDIKLEAENAELKAEFKDYKNETTALINSLVVTVNSLTPVRTLLIVRQPRITA